MPTYDIDFEANGKQQRLTVEGTRPPTSEEAGQLIMQALGQQKPVPVATPAPPQTPGNERVTIDVVKGEGATQVTDVPQPPKPRTNLMETPEAAEVTKFLDAPFNKATNRGGLPAIAEGVATLAVPGPLKPFAGALGAGAGELTEQLVRGEPLNLKKAATESGLSLVPEVVESAARGIGRTILRNVPGGTRIRFDEAARQARQLAPEVFQPQTRDVVGDMFEQVRRSGVKLETKALEQEITSLNGGKYDALLSEVKRLDNQYKTGGRYTNLLESLRGNLPRQVGYDIGDLQQFRSAVGQRVRALEPVEAKQLLRDLQVSIDDTIDFGLSRGVRQVGNEPEVLRAARGEWARLRAAEDMGHMVERAITSTPDLAMNSFNLRAFFDTLRKGDSEISRNVNRALDRTPGARERFMQGLDDISQQFRTIEVPLTDVSGWRRNFIIAGLGQAISSILLTDVGQRLFRDTIVNGRGQLSPNAIALLVNAARRETMPGLTAAEEAP